MARALPLQLPDSDSDEYFDAYNEEELRESWQLNERDILRIAGEIGNEWMSIGIHLGYKRATLCHLEDVYPRQPQWRNFMMIAEWCDVVYRLCLNARKCLAKILFNAEVKHIADRLCAGYELFEIPEKVFHHIDNISFDKPHLVTLGQYNVRYIEGKIGIPNQQVFEIDISQIQQSVVQHFQTEDRFSIVKRSPIIQLPMISECSGGKSDDGGVWSLREIENALPANCETSKESEFSKLLNELSLAKFYPGRITLSEARKIRSKNQNICGSTLPWLLLSKIIMLNFNARETDLNVLYDNKIETPQESDPDSDEDAFDDPTIGSINPMDLLYVTFLCCDHVLKQEIISKLYMCKLAIPFLYRDSDGLLTLSHWTLRTILIDKRTEDKSIQVDPLHHEAKIVTFFRIGHQSLSKSKIINEILSDRHQPTFFNRDCQLGTSLRKVADGIVEASWYIPGGKESVIFSDLTMFLNLRGDCTNYQEEVALLCKLSHTIVIHTDVEQLDRPSSRDILLKIHEYKLPVIYALESGTQSRIQPHQRWKEYKSSMQDFKSQMKVFNLKQSLQPKSSSDITKEMRKLLTETVIDKNASKLIHLTETLEISDVNRFPELSESMQKATETMACISQSGVEKEGVLPLQGRLWSKWCTYMKALYKETREEAFAAKESEMVLIRAEQIHTFKCDTHPFMCMFLHYLELDEGQIEQKIHFLSWMKILLDEKCRDIVPQLVFQYQQRWLDMRCAVANNHFESFQRLQKAVSVAEQELVEASFGLEHLIREMGQIYEAVASNCEYVSSSVMQFPAVVSKLIQHGYPLEVMDGDTAMVPPLWVGAVLNQLKEDIGDKRLLTISVLGIQSSGKSTLLNAMFGLQFAVSAGRCTRGVFAQLVKVENKTLPYDFVLVLDSEGLRAPELSDKTHTHDNELATFVIGLGNITIINIKGENTHEMEDVLQIAVHAFLRLKMANANLQMQQTCLFVHQNVPAIDAPMKMTHARQKMMDKLDRLTKEAATQEGLVDIHSFSQVIDINPQEHMWYFSDLWYGDPPMAPINLGYHTNVQEVKQHILYDFPAKKKTFLSISETKTRMQDLSTGILSENFVFSFRNSLEVKAYHMMDATFQTIILNIENAMRQFLQTDANIQMIRCANEQQLDQKYDSLTHSLNNVLMQVQEEQITLWNSFIDSCPLRDIIEQWRQTRILQIQEIVISIMRDGQNSLHGMKAHKNAELVSTKKRPLHESELRIKAESLANKYRGKSLSKRELNKTFNDTWDNWVGGVEHARTPEKPMVRNEIDKIVYELFHADGHLIGKEMKRKTNTVYEKLGQLKNSLSNKELKDDHISVSQSLLDKVFMSKKEICKEQAWKIINMILGKIDAFLTNVMSEDMPFEKSNAKRVFMILIEVINSHNAGIDNTCNFSFTAPFRVMMAVHISRYITVFFARIDSRYEATHNVVAQMEKYKSSVWQYFIDVYENKKEEVKLANILINSVAKILIRQIETLLPYEVVTTIINGCFSTKYSLMLAIMKDLADKEAFDSYYWYLNDAESFALHWLTEFTNNHIFRGNGTSGSIYMDIVNRLLTSYIQVINESAETATQTAQRQRRSDMHIWIKLFEKHLSKHLPIPFNFFAVKQNTSVDFKNLHNNFIENFKYLQITIEDFFHCDVDDFEHSVKWTGVNPYTQILDKLWGCKEKCPFCNETCQKTRKEHTKEKHTCIQHRPPGLVGVRFINSDVLCWRSCNYEVYSSDLFYCGAVNRKCQTSGMCNGGGYRGNRHRFREYALFLPDWEIEPSSLMNSSNYWMWFLFKFRKDLQRIYQYKLPPKIRMLDRITKQDAISSLQIMH